jgi:hypothetical protein
MRRGPERDGRTAQQLPGNARWRSPAEKRSGRSVSGQEWDPAAHSFLAGGRPRGWRVRAGEMLQEESDLSLIIAQIVQKLKGSNLYAQLERQAWVSGADGKLWRPAGRRMTCLLHCLHPGQSFLLSPPLSAVLNPSLSLAPCLLRPRSEAIVFF